MLKMTKILSFALVFALIISSTAGIAFAYNNENEKMPGLLKGETITQKTRNEIQNKKHEIPPVIKEGKFLIPTKPLTKIFGVDLEWDAEEKILTMKKDDNVLIFDMKNDKITVNGKEVNLKNYGFKGRIIPVGLIFGLLRGNLDVDEEIEEDEDDVDDEENYQKIDVINDNVTGTGKGQFEYVGNWQYGRQEGAYKNDNHWSNRANDYVLFRFTGNQIRLFGAKADSHGIAAVSIDGGSEVLIDYYASERKDNTLLYISPELQDGDHILKVRVTGMKNSDAKDYYVTVDKVEVINFSENSAILEGIVYDTPSSVNLSLQGKLDWVHWGYDGINSFNRKESANSAPYISDYTKIGTGMVSWVSDIPVKYSWIDGIPATKASNVSSAIFTSGIGNGFQFTALADTKIRVLKIYVSAWDATGAIEVSLSDGSATPYTFDIVSESGIVCKVITIRYRAESPDEKLIVKYTVKSASENSINNISLQAAALK